MGSGRSGQGRLRDLFQSSIWLRGVFLFAAAAVLQCVSLSGLLLLNSVYRSSEAGSGRTFSRIIMLSDVEVLLDRARNSFMQLHAAPRDAGHAKALQESLERAARRLSAVARSIGTDRGAVYRNRLGQAVHETASLARTVEGFAAPDGVSRGGPKLERHTARIRHSLRRAAKLVALIERTTLRSWKKDKVTYSLWSRRVFLSVIVLVVSLSVVLAWSWQIFLGRTYRRIARITENVGRLEQSLSLIPPDPSNDEIGRLDHALYATAKALVSKSEENEMFVYGVSHDLRAPLLNLEGFSNELEASLDHIGVLLRSRSMPEEERIQSGRAVEEEIRTCLRFIRSAVDRLSSAIDGLLRISRAGKVELSFNWVDVASVVQRIVDSHQADIQQKRVTVKLGSLPSVWSDSSAIEQVMGNLISNALKYLDPNRSGEVTIDLADNPVELPGKVFVVKDNGLGLPAAAHKKIFHVFQRLHASVAPGEGIGLAIVKRIVERLGGRVWFESTEGEGTSFYFFLPEKVGAEIV